MEISILGCPFTTSYGAYIQSLKEAIEKRTGTPVQWIASNCGCGDPVERSRIFQSPGCDYFEMPVLAQSESVVPWKRQIRNCASEVVFRVRARRFARLQHAAAQVAHFQQILNAYGASAVFHWLRRPASSARVVTVHELDDFQLQRPDTNRTYNRADALIVHCEDMRTQLVGLGVQPQRVHVVRHGVHIPAIPMVRSRRSGPLIFYGGHKLMQGKGIQTLFDAMARIGSRLGPSAPRLKIHGHYGTKVPQEALKLAEQHGIAGRIDWLNQISIEDMARHYQDAAACVLPFTGSFAGLPAAVAAAHGLPVIATRKAGIPDHLGEHGIWVEEGNPIELAGRIIELLGNDAWQWSVSSALRARAEKHLAWSVIAERTLQVYAAARNAALRRAA